MAANTTPVFTLTGFGSPASMTQVNTDITGQTGSFTTIVTAGSNGARVKGIVFVGVTATQATRINIWHNNGGTLRKVGEGVDVNVYVTGDQPRPAFTGPGHRVRASRRRTRPMILPCDKCDGACCKVNPRFGFVTADDGTRIMFTHGRCPNLTDANTCAIYETRPKACRRFDCSKDSGFLKLHPHVALLIRGTDTGSASLP